MKYAPHLTASILFCSLFSSMNATAAEGYFYLGVDGAYSNKVEKEAADPSFQVTSQSTSIGGMRLLGGYHFTPNIALELGYTQREDYQQAAKSKIMHYNANVAIDNYDITGVYRFTEGLHGAFLTAGVVWTTINTTAQLVTPFGTMHISDTKKRRDFQYGVGYQGNIVGALDWRIGLSHYGQDNILFLGMRYAFSQ